MESQSESTQHWFHLPIGDYSGDGHGRCRVFVVSSNQPVEIVKAAQKDLINTVGIDLYSLCDDDEDTIWESDRDELIALGVDADLFTQDPYNDEKYEVTATAMATIWLTLLMKAKPGLKLSIVHVPSLFGKEFVGYGCNTSYMRD